MASVTRDLEQEPLYGYATRQFQGAGDVPRWDWNRCVPHLEVQVKQLRQRGDLIGTRMGGYPDVTQDHHWQGVVRLPTVGTQPVFVLDSDHDDVARFGVATLGDPSDGARIRGNRFSAFHPDWCAVPPDEIVLEQSFGSHKHPGGMQALGTFLFVPLEAGDNNALGRISVWDMSAFGGSCDPSTKGACLGDELWSADTLTEYAALASIAKLSNGGYVLGTAGQDSEIYEFRITDGSRSIDDPAVFADAKLAMLDRSVVPGFRTYYQHASFLTGCPETDGQAGQLYLLGTTSASGDESGDDYADLFVINFFEGGDPTWPGTEYRVEAELVASRHLYCSSSSYARHCDFIAGVGTYVDPAGRLLLYASEHANDGTGDSVKMVEFRPPNHLDDLDTPPIEGCVSIEDAFVELYDDVLDSSFGPTTSLPGTQRSYMIDYRERARRSLEFDAAYGFNDAAMAVRYCIPSGYAYRLYEHENKSGASAVLRGDGSLGGVGDVSGGYIKGYSWKSNPGWSSGCFTSSSSAQCL